MDEDASATDIDKEYKDDEDEDEKVIAEEEVEPEGWVKHTMAASCVQEAFLQSTVKHGKSNQFLAKGMFYTAVMDGKVDHLWKHISGMCMKVFKSRAKILVMDWKHISGMCKKVFKPRAKIVVMDWKGGTTAAMETNPVEAVNSPLTASGISAAAFASMSSCASRKRAMN